MNVSSMPVAHQNASGRAGARAAIVSGALAFAFRPRERRLLGRRGSAHGQDASAAADVITWTGEVSASAGSASLMRRKVASAWPTTWSML